MARPTIRPPKRLLKKNWPEFSGSVPEIIKEHFMFYGWYVVAGTFVSQLAVVGFFSYSISLLTPLIREEFGVSLEQVMYSLTAGIFTGMILQPLAGVMLDRANLRLAWGTGKPCPVHCSDCTALRGANNSRQTSRCGLITRGWQARCKCPDRFS